jgi:hypothetical protein
VKVRYCDGGSFTGDGADAVRAILSYVSKLCKRKDINVSIEPEILSF